MALPPEVESLPEFAQKVVGGLAFLGVVGAMVLRFFSKGQESDEHKTVVLERAETADLNVVRRLSKDLEPLPEVLEEIRRVISNQDRNFGLLDRFNTTLDRNASKIDVLLEGQGRVIGVVERTLIQLEPALVLQREMLEILRRQERAREMREEMEKLFRSSESKVPPIK